MYDVIIVGARVAGSSTAMLLAGKGLRVLLVDRATLPERHALDPSGAAPGRGEAPALGPAGPRSWPRARRRPGRCGSTPARSCSRAATPPSRGSTRVYSPRRTVLDALLRGGGAGGRGRGARAVHRRGAHARGRAGQRHPRALQGGPAGHRGGPRWSSGRTASTRWSPGRCGAAVPPRPAAPDDGAATPTGMTCRSRGARSTPRPRRAIGAWPTNDGLTLTLPGLAGRGVPGLPGRRRRQRPAHARPGRRPGRAGPGRPPRRAVPGQPGPAQLLPRGRSGRGGRSSGTPAW